MCRKFIAKAASGGADLDTWDPVNAKYLRDLGGTALVNDTTAVPLGDARTQTRARHRGWTPSRSSVDGI